LDIEDVMITKCEYYSDMGQRKKRPVITQKIQGEIKGKNVLLVDDVSDTGESLKEIKKYLLGLEPALLSTATLYIKPWSIFMPDYYASKTAAWIIFPWEPYEAIKSLSRKNGPEVLKETKIPIKLVQRLSKMDTSLLPTEWQSAINEIREQVVS
jgi:hypoxanthine phosphoribosyltransferase